MTNKVHVDNVSGEEGGGGDPAMEVRMARGTDEFLARSSFIFCLHDGSCLRACVGLEHKKQDLFYPMRSVALFFFFFFTLSPPRDKKSENSFFYVAIETAHTRVRDLKAQKKSGG